MDPFVTRIGDVTIQRVTSKSNSPQDLKDESLPEVTSTKTEDTSVSPEVEKDPSPSDSVKDKVEDLPQSELANKEIKTESPPNQSPKADIKQSVDKLDGIEVNEADCKEKITGDGQNQDKSKDDCKKEGTDEEDTEMDASQFLEMAQTEEAEIKESKDGLVVPSVDSPSTSKSGDNEELEEGEDELLSHEGEGTQSQEARNLSRNEIDAKIEPTDDSENLQDDENMQDEDDDDANEDFDDNYGEQEYEGMEDEEMALGQLEGMAAVKVENVEDLKETLCDDQASVKSEPSGESSKKVDRETGGDQQEGTDIKKKLRTRQKRKILVDDDTDESEEERKKKRKKRRKKGGKGDDSGTSEETESEDDGSGKKKKKKKKKPGRKAKKKDDDDGSGGEKEKKSSNMRRNIRDVMDEAQLDEATLSAQRQEMERLRRVQEQQRVLREMAIQRQQQQRAERAEHKVLSLLQGNTSILKQVTVGPSTAKGGSSSSSPNTVVVKVGSGSTAQSNKKVLELLKVPKGSSSDIKPSVTKALLSKPQSLQGTTMMTPSVSIAPVRAGIPGQKSSSIGKQPSLIQPVASYSASEGEEDEDEDEEEDEEELIDEEAGEEGKKKKKDVVTISSSSEDDCIVLSEPSDLEEDEAEEDPTNSGMHTNDAYNVPDDEGRVQVNMGKPEGDPDIFLAPHIARIIKPHQIGGIRFLYDNIIESIERFNTSTGFGCILAHSMGLGKTLQVITFCDIFLRHTPAKTVMCIMPINTLQNWLAEFNMWMPDDALATPLAAQGEVRPRTFNIHVLNDSHKTLKARAKVVEDWTTGGGVLLIGYEMYRQLSLKKVSKPKRSRRKRPASDEEDLDPEEEEKRQKEILEKVYEALVKPGPDLVICDEGHRIKNSHASISMALKQIRSKRRIVLTGYPLQNNLLEYWCMVDFVRPNYLGTKTEFCNMFERPIQNGQCIDSTPQDIRLMRYRAHVLHSLLEGFVQRRSHAVLQTALPQKEEYVLLVRLTPFQRKLYDTFMNEVVRTKAVPNPLKAFAVCCKIWNHPDVLYQFLKKREGGEGVDLDLEEAAAAIAANTVTDPTGTPVEERKAATKGRGRGGGGSGKGRKKKETSPNNKPAAAVLPNSSSQSDPSNPYNLSGQYPAHGQMNSNAMMGPYNPYSAPGHQPYGSFNAPHHYNPSGSYGLSGYSGASGFNANSSSLGLNSAGQSSFSGSGSSGYGDSLASSPASQSSQYGSSSNQSLFNNSTPTNSTSNAPGYGSMGPPYFSGNSSSAPHASMTDGFSASSNYSQSWSGSNSYNSFNQGPSGNQPFSGSSYGGSSGQNPSFQGYGSSSSTSFNQSMYGGGSGGSTGSSSQSYQPGMLDQQMLDQNLMAPPNRPTLIPQQSPVNASGMLPGGAPMKKLDQNVTSVSHCGRWRPNETPHQSPVNASGMLPGGAPTKNPAMIPPSMGSGLTAPGMGASMGNSALGMNALSDAMLGHHSQGMALPNMYHNPAMLGMQGQPSNHAHTGPMNALSSMASSDVPPSAEDLLHSASDDFRAFDSSMKTDSNRAMYDVKDRNMFDPWGNSQSQSQDFSMMSGQDVKSTQSPGIKKSDSENFSPETLQSGVCMKSDIRDMKIDSKSDSDHKDIASNNENSDDHVQKDVEIKDTAESWRVDSMEIAGKEKDGSEDKEKEGKEEEEDVAVGPDGKTAVETPAVAKQFGKEDPGIPYDWAVELMKDYVPGLIENSAKMVLFFCVLEEALALGDRILLFSQSLFTLSLIEDYLQRSYIPAPGVYERWQRNRSYFRLDGSTTAIEREKLINEFNANPNVYLFLVSTRAGSLGINLVGANRVIVFDASWNPCHDTQAVCRVYRYGQKKPCFVYRFVMDNCLEKKIYDRQINKQGMSDRIVDECNPDAHLSIKEVTNLCYDDDTEAEIKDLSDEKENYTDTAMQKIVEKYGKLLTKAPFQHESLLVDRKDKKLSQAEKRLAKRSYEMEKRANNRPVYNYYNPAQGGLQIRPIQRDAAGNVIKPIASVRPMQADGNSSLATGNKNTKWIPAEVWQRQGMSAQEMTLPLDVVIPTNSPERSSIVLKAGQRVMVLKSPKGIYMQLENGKIIAIRTAFKMGANNKTESKPFAVEKDELRKGANIGMVNKGNIKLTSGIHPLRNNPNITITPRAAPGPVRGIRPNIITRPPGVRMQTTANMRPWVRPGGVAGRAVPLRPGQNLRPGIRGLSPSVTVTPANAKSRTLGPVTITPRLAPANFLGMKTGESTKEKAKVDSKNEIKTGLDKLENDECQNSNSSADAPSISNKSSTTSSSVEEKSDKGKDSHQAMKENSASVGSIDGAHDSAKSFKERAVSENTMIERRLDMPTDMSSLSAQDKPMNPMSDTSLKGFHHSSSNQRHQDVNKPSNLDKRENSSNISSYTRSSVYNSSEKGPPQSSSMGFPGNFSSSGSKQYISNHQGGTLMSPPSYNTSADRSIDDSKSSSSIDNQWKSPSAPQVFSAGVPSSKSASQQRGLESSSYDDNSNASAHSSIPSKSSAHGSSLDSRPQPSGDPSYGASDLSTSLSKSSSKPPSSTIPSAAIQSGSSSSKSSESLSSSSSSNFPLDAYANLYGSYGAYSGALPSSNYYSPYSYPPGFLPDPKSSLPSKSSTELNQSASASSSRSSSKSSSSLRTESRKSSHESSRSSLSSGYESRQSSSTSSSSSSAHRTSSSSAPSSTPASSSSAADSSFPSSSSATAAAVAAAAYNPMMMSPSFNPTTCQYPPPATASGSTNPFTAAAAAAANYPPYASPYSYPGTNQFESDLARASMYSAFHRPEAGLDPTSPYLPLPAHSRPVTGTPASAGSFYSQNVYGSQYGSSRDPYSQLPYPGSPLFMPPAPYSGLSSSTPSTTTSDQSPSQ